MNLICGVSTFVLMGSIMCFNGYEDVDSCYTGPRTDDVFLSFTFQRDAQDETGVLRINPIN